MGTPSSENVSANTITAARAIDGQIAGTTIRMITRKGLATTRAASSSDGSTPRAPRPVKATAMGEKASDKTKTAPASLNNQSDVAAEPTKPERPNKSYQPRTSRNGGTLTGSDSASARNLRPRAFVL